MHGPGRPGGPSVVCLAACLAACATTTGLVSVTPPPERWCDAGAGTSAEPLQQRDRRLLHRPVDRRGRRGDPRRETRPGHLERGLQGRRGGPRAGARGGRPGGGVSSRSSPRATGGTGSRTAAVTVTSTASASRSRPAAAAEVLRRGTASTRPRTGMTRSSARGFAATSRPPRRWRCAPRTWRTPRGRSRVPSAGTCSVWSSPGCARGTGRCRWCSAATRTSGTVTARTSRPVSPPAPRSSTTAARSTSSRHRSSSSTTSDGSICSAALTTRACSSRSDPARRPPAGIPPSGGRSTG